MSDNVAEEQAPASAADEFYGEDMFDDLIAKAMESEPKNNGGGSKKKKSKSKRNKKDDDSIDIVADIEAGNNNNDDDINDNDANSLDSGEISGESDISEVEEKVKSYIAPPLVNDDESTIDMRPPAPANRDQTVSSYVDQLNQQERSKSRLIRVGAFAILIAIVVGVILAVISLTGDKGGDGAITDGNSFTVANPGAEGDGPQKVSPSSPEVEGTVEIQNMGIPTAKPTTIQPVPTEIVDTIHPVQLTFDNVPLGYRLPEDDRESIIGFLTELLKDYLDDSFGLLGVAYARDIGGVDIGKKKKRYLIPSTTRRRRLESISLPLVIRLSGPSNFSEDFVRAYVIEVIEDRVRNIASYLKAVDYDAFKSVRISPSTYDINDVLKPTPAPSVSPVTSTPSVSPQRTPSVSPILPPQTNGPTKEEVSETSDIVVGTIVNSAPTKPPTRRPKPTREPSRPPSRYPTVEPTPDPTPLPTNRITPRPTPLPTPRPSLKPIYDQYANRPNPSPSTPTQYSPTKPNNPPQNLQPSYNQQPSSASKPVNIPQMSPNVSPSSGRSHYCAKVSYTPGWNILLDFGYCDKPCPSTLHTECESGEYQCQLAQGTACGSGG